MSKKREREVPPKTLPQSLSETLSYCLILGKSRTYACLIVLLQCLITNFVLIHFGSKSLFIMSVAPSIRRHDNLFLTQCQPFL